MNLSLRLEKELLAISDHSSFLGLPFNIDVRGNHAVVLYEAPVEIGEPQKAL